MADKIPLISVIIPMYNCEKYIEQCLDSIMSQTFKDFEVIIVDDCSTDRSVEIVGKIMTQRSSRGGVMHLVKLPSNSGMAAFPRNRGVKLARGKYVMFIDNDDLLTENALETFFDIAEQFNADVVHTERYWSAKSLDDPNRKKGSFQSAPFISKITLETDDIGKRIARFCKGGFLWSIWSKLYRREFLIKNQIECPKIIWTEDAYFTFACVCLAKNYVRIPDVVYIYRNNPSSVSHKHLGLDGHFHRYVPALSGGLKYLHKIFVRHPFFNEHPEFKTMATDFFINGRLGRELGVYQKYPPHTFEPFLLKEFGKETGEDAEVVMTYLFNKLNVFNVKLHEAQDKIAQLEETIKNYNQQRGE